MIVDLVNEAVQSGARIHKAADTIGISARTIIRWRRQDGGVDRRKGPKTIPANKLSKQECEHIVEVANSVELGYHVFTYFSPWHFLLSLHDSGRLEPKNCRCPGVYRRVYGAQFETVCKSLFRS